MSTFMAFEYHISLIFIKCYVLILTKIFLHRTECRMQSETMTRMQYQLNWLNEAWTVSPGGCVFVLFGGVGVRRTFGNSLSLIHTRRHLHVAPWLILYVFLLSCNSPRKHKLWLYKRSSLPASDTTTRVSLLSTLHKWSVSTSPDRLPLYYPTGMTTSIKTMIFLQSHRNRYLK